MVMNSGSAAHARLRTGIRVVQWYLALQTYHRHQVPTPDMHAWDQFRGRDGKPIYPQRNLLIGPISAFHGAGSNQTGRLNGKMIVLESLMDIDALPWQANWYRTKVKQALGSSFNDNYRLYFIDHASILRQPGWQSKPARSATRARCSKRSVI